MANSHFRSQSYLEKFQIATLTSGQADKRTGGQVDIAHRVSRHAKAWSPLCYDIAYRASRIAHLVSVSFSYFCKKLPMQEVDKISVRELTDMAEKMYGNLVKAVVDLKLGLLVVDAELHSDEEYYLLEQGSEQGNLWGINLYPQEYGTEKFIEFDSMINIRPRQQNMTRGVEDKEIREKIISLVQGKISE